MKKLLYSLVAIAFLFLIMAPIANAGFDVFPPSASTVSGGTATNLTVVQPTGSGVAGLTIIARSTNALRVVLPTSTNTVVFSVDVSGNSVAQGGGTYAGDLVAQGDLYADNGSFSVTGGGAAHMFSIDSDNDAFTTDGAGNLSANTFLTGNTVIDQNSVYADNVNSSFITSQNGIDSSDRITANGYISGQEFRDYSSGLTVILTTNITAGSVSASLGFSAINTNNYVGMSPNGTKYRINISDIGVVTTSVVP